MGRWVSHELVGPGPRFAWTLLLAVAALALSAYAGRRVNRTAGPGAAAVRTRGLEPAGQRRQLRRRRALAQRQRRVAARTARRRRRTNRRLRRRRAVQARLHLEIDLTDASIARQANRGWAAAGAHANGSNGAHRPNGAALGSNGARLPVDLAIDISVDLAADLVVGNVPPLPVVYESEITLESGETLECGIVAPFRTR